MPWRPRPSLNTLCLIRPWHAAPPEPRKPAFSVIRISWGFQAHTDTDIGAWTILTRSKRFFSHYHAYCERILADSLVINKAGLVLRDQETTATLDPCLELASPDSIRIRGFHQCLTTLIFCNYATYPPPPTFAKVVPISLLKHRRKKNHPLELRNRKICKSEQTRKKKYYQPNKK